MAEIDNGGPLTPQVSIMPGDGNSGGVQTFHYTGGLTIRDYFAGQALAGTVSGGWVPDSEADLAKRLYSLADAMIAERAKGGK